MNKLLAHSIGLGKPKSQDYVKKLFMSIYVMYMGQASVKKPSKTRNILQQRRLQAK